MKKVYLFFLVLATTAGANAQSITVNDKNDDPLPNAVVIKGAEQRLTGDDGKATFSTDDGQDPIVYYKGTQYVQEGTSPTSEEIRKLSVYRERVLVVKDVDGNPVSDVTITVGNASATTGDDGLVKFYQKDLKSASNMIVTSGDISFIILFPYWDPSIVLLPYFEPANAERYILYISVQTE
jgi:hypothetical protein